MLRLKTHGLWLLLLLLQAQAGRAQKPGTSLQDQIIVSSTSPACPVFKGLSANPLVRVRVYVPEGVKEVDYRNIRCRLNQAGVQDIEKLEVYFTDREPLFSTANLIASVSPTVTAFDIPVPIKLQPGLHYIWFSAALRSSADLDHKIEFHAQSLKQASGKMQSVREDRTSFRKRLGLALRKAGDEGVNAYRIPGITTTDKGTLVAVYDIRYKSDRDLPANIDVGMSRSTDGGKTWEPMKVIMDMGEPHENNGIGDPSILFDPVERKLWVAALWSKGNRSIAGSEPGLSPDTTGQFVLVSSADDGLTWSEPVSITAQVKNPTWHLYFQGPGSGIAMQDGTLVFPSQYWDESKKPGLPHSSIIYSRDHGKTWKSGVGAKPNTTESQVVESRPGILMLNMRDNRGGFRSTATTRDLGRTWTEHFTSYSTLPDPVCMGSLIKASVKINKGMREVLFFSNPNSSTARINMTIKASLDAGESWKAANQLLLDERRLYGYSSLAKIDDQTIGILYEGVRELYFVRLPVSEIIRQD